MGPILCDWQNVKVTDEDVSMRRYTRGPRRHDILREKLEGERGKGWIIEMLRINKKKKNSIVPTYIPPPGPEGMKPSSAGLDK